MTKAVEKKYFFFKLLYFTSANQISKLRSNVFQQCLQFKLQHSNVMQN